MSSSHLAVAATRRYELACDLLIDFGFELAAPVRLPKGFISFSGSPWLGQWHLRGIPLAAVGESYIELSETTDTRTSYPEPIDYEYLVHLDRGPGNGRNISFHKHPHEYGGPLYHWHDYPDGLRHGLLRLGPAAMNPVTLRWFVNTAWELLVEPNLSVRDLFGRMPAPGPDDPT